MKIDQNLFTCGRMPGLRTPKGFTSVADIESIKNAPAREHLYSQIVYINMCKSVTKKLILYTLTIRIIVSTT